MEITIEKTIKEKQKVTLALPYYFKNTLDSYFMIKSEEEIIKVDVWDRCPSIAKFTIINSHLTESCTEIESKEFLEKFEEVSHALKGMVI